MPSRRTCQSCHQEDTVTVKSYGYIIKAGGKHMRFRYRCECGHRFVRDWDIDIDNLEPTATKPTNTQCTHLVPFDRCPTCTKEPT